MDNKSKVTLKFYTITSNFNDILLRLCKKIIDSEEKVYVNFETDETKAYADKFLWTREKNNFLPHKVDGEKISSRDKIVLFNGSFAKMKFLRTFNSLIISPCVSIKKFDFFKKFLVFSYAKDELFNKKISDQLIKRGFIINWYDEHSSFKWKQIL